MQRTRCRPDAYRSLERHATIDSQALSFGRSFAHTVRRRLSSVSDAGSAVSDARGCPAVGLLPYIGNPRGRETKRADIAAEQAQMIRLAGHTCGECHSPRAALRTERRTGL